MTSSKIRNNIWKGKRNKMNISGAPWGFSVKCRRGEEKTIVKYSQRAFRVELGN